MPGSIADCKHLQVSAADAGQRLDRFLACHLPFLSRSKAQELIREGHVALSEGHPKPSLAVWEGLAIDVTIPAVGRAVPAPQNLPLQVLYADDDLAVIDKPAGMVVHPGAGHREGTLVSALLHHFQGLSSAGGHERPGIVHRLDRGTSGVMVVARHDRAHRELARQFAEREVRKEYIALVWGTMTPGTSLSTPIGRDPRHRQKMSSRARRARPALTEILSSEPLGGVTLVRVALGTGRTHQIRVHLGESGHPVAGDALYGGARRSVPPRLAALSRLGRPFLHAARLGFAHPVTGEPLTFEAPLPEDLQTVLDALRKASHRSRKDVRA
jgi:23S rRNA pseudouridine1911/1915/1917 synthase